MLTVGLMVPLVLEETSLVDSVKLAPTAAAPRLLMVIIVELVLTQMIPRLS